MFSSNGIFFSSTIATQWGQFNSKIAFESTNTSFLINSNIPTNFIFAFIIFLRNYLRLKLECENFQISYIKPVSNLTYIEQRPLKRNNWTETSKILSFISFSSYEQPIQISNFYNDFFSYLLFEFFVR